MNLEEHENKSGEIWALLKDTNEQLNRMAAEWRQRSEEWEKQFKKEGEQWKQEFNEKNAAWEKRSQATDKKINKVAGLFDTQWGKLMESLVEGGVLKLFQDRGVRVTEVQRRVESNRNGRSMELDLLLANQSDIVVIEVKTTLKAKHVHNFLKRMDEFLTFFPRYKEQTIYGGVAALRIEQESGRYAAKQGLFALQVGGDGLVKFLNDEAFKARNFG